jgi:WD40 repeat protein
MMARLNTTFTSWTNTAAYSPDGRLIALGGADGKLAVFDALTASRLTINSEPSQITAVQYTADGRTLFAASADGVVRGWPAHSRTINGLGGPVFNIGYDGGGSRLAVASTGASGVLSLWSTHPDGGGPTKLATWATPATFGAVDGTEAISTNGRLIAAGNRHGQVLVGTVADNGTPGPSTRLLDGGTKTIESVAFSPNGLTVAAGSDDGYVHLWDVHDPTNPMTLPSLNADGEVASVAFSPDGRYLAAASVDHQVHLWQISDPTRAKVLPNLSGFRNYAWSVAFSPDSTLLAAGGADDTVRIWNITNPQDPHLVSGPLGGPTHYVNNLSFSPDGKQLAAAAGDGSVWTWSLDPSGSAKMTAKLQAADPGGNTYAVAFSPDGKTLAAAGSDGQLVQWSIGVDLAAAICATAGDELSQTEWAQYIPTAPYRRMCLD